MLTHDNFNIRDWNSTVNEYEHTKKILPWGATMKPEVLTHKIMKERDSAFNPILQTYNNRNNEHQAKSQEKNVKSQHLAKSLVSVTQ